MVNPTFKRVVSPVLNPIGYALFMSRFADLGLAERHGPRSEMQVALTFDDGPVLGGTEEVFETLGEFGVHGTFFCVGANAQLHPELVLRGYQAGHVMGAHSMHHARITAVKPVGTAHIDECLTTLQNIMGVAPALYRPPWGWLTPWETLRLRQRGLAVIRWDIETADSDLPCPPGAEIFEWTLPRVQPGSIIVCHDGTSHAQRYEKPETVRLLRLLIPELRSRGYSFVTVPEMLGIPAYQGGSPSIPSMPQTSEASAT